MYKVMIIDDEKALRNLLKKIVPWEELGLVVVGEAASGSEAIHIMDDIQPELVLVDIRMPFMDGIEFSRLARKRYPGLKIVILTAYNEFDYARACIGIGVSDYLLKPVNRREVYQVLEKIVSGMNREQRWEACAGTCGQGQMEKREFAGDQEVTRGTIEKIEKFLKDNYRDSQMNLTSVAQEFGLNPSYLSRKFKQETKKSFVDYLTGYRMEQATKLAAQGEVMYLAAEQVGIRDPNYFGKCFKKYRKEGYSECVRRHGA